MIGTYFLVNCLTKRVPRYSYDQSKKLGDIIVILFLYYFTGTLLSAVADVNDPEAISPYSAQVQLGMVKRRGRYNT